MYQTFYRDQTQFYVAVDCIIFGFSEGRLSLLLLKRNMEPAKGQWSLPGGFIEAQESSEVAAARVLSTLTGLDEVYMDQLMLFSKIDRDPGERVLSVAFYALINVADSNREQVRLHNAYWRDLDDLPALIFDHPEMVHSALKRLRIEASTKPIGFNLLPERFTVPQLQALYEAIYGISIDKRNFRKKLQSMPFLVKLDEKDKTSSKRGAYLYSFDKERYEKAKLEGIHFAL
ncbi:MAG: NUDIX domain-containing protein [Bacteroidales bacterium]|jgi:ADP-ribose pyrophosphatase YjhB (NUDIX family)|nr:NUDIX domain-containing protein [Bacteroidales bacterium]HKL93364.1 NUDIX domain-containing protein [Bacteroidales bacterium]